MRIIKPIKTRLAALPALAALLFAAAACALPLTAQPTPAPTQPPTPTSGPTITPMPSLPATTPTNPAPAALIPTVTDTFPGALEVNQVQVYLVALNDNGASGKAVGCGDSLVPVTRQITPSNQPIAAALGELFAIKQQNYGQSGLYNALWQADLKVQRVDLDPTGVASVYIGGNVLMGGECDTPRFKGQIEQTILAIQGVRRADIFLNGKPIDEALSLK